VFSNVLPLPSLFWFSHLMYFVLGRLYSVAASVFVYVATIEKEINSDYFYI